MTRVGVASFDHSHKKLKDNQEIRAEPTVLRAYVENRAILEPTFPYRASKWTQNKGIRTVYGPTSQSVFTFSKLTIETLEQDVKYVQS